MSTLSGYIYGIKDNSEPYALSNAYIEPLTIEPGPAINEGAFSDSEGKYSIVDVGNGTWRIEITYEGTIYDAGTITLNGDMTKDFTITLQSISPEPEPDPDVPIPDDNPYIAEDEYWVEILLNGPVGSPGLDVNLKYAWNGAINYNTKDVVYYKDGLYVATQPNINQIPSASSSYWALFLTMPRAKILVSQVSPSNEEIYDGLIWFRIMQTLIWEQVDNKNLTFEDIDNMHQTWDFIDEGGW